MMPTYFDRARAFTASLNPPFASTGAVTLTGLDPNCPQGQWKIDRASAWAADRSKRRGLSSRRVDAAAHNITWEFEDQRDAVEFRLLF
jgi:hypothetical protein